MSVREPADERPKDRNRELSRADRLSVAFVKGALLGMAAADVLGLAIGIGFRMAVAPSLTSTAQAYPWEPYFVLQQMLWPIGLVVGGIIARGRLQKSSPGSNVPGRRGMEQA